MLYDFDDLLIQPAAITSIRSRSQVNPFYMEFIEQGSYRPWLPLMTAPMDTVINEENLHYFTNLGIMPVLPRINQPDSTHVNYDHFLSYSLTDFDRLFLENTIEVPGGYQVHALIDIANGHMRDLLKSAKEAKRKYGKSLVLMVGNVANPQTYYDYSLADVDYIRIGIGNGGGCLIATAAYGSEMAPQVQLLREIRDNQLMNTESGSAFMSTFNELYYTFSPTIADMERESPMFKEIVKAGLTPMLSTLAIMENAESESEVLGLGLSVIALNLGMYIGLPAFGIIKVIQSRKN